MPAVTELVISELLWLNYSSPEKPVYVYLNSIGSQTADGQAVGFETEAYAILDTLNYIRPDIHTLVVGQAYGNAAMILASGKKGLPLFVAQRAHHDGAATAQPVLRQRQQYHDQSQ